MLNLYVPSGSSLHAYQHPQDVPDLSSCVWFDLLNPTREEELLVEDMLGIDAPTREDMQEIELSSRLYSESDAVFMTATVLVHMDSVTPTAAPITFVLKGDRLLTLRYADPRPFTTFAARAQRPTSGYTTGSLIFTGLLEAFVNRIADVLEEMGTQIDSLSAQVFVERSDKLKNTDFKDTLRLLGRKGDLCSKARESLISLTRLTHYASDALDVSHLPQAKDVKNRLMAIDRDVTSMLDHVSFLNSKVAFLLEATLGLINIEQNAIIKLFSVVSVALMPPTLIASIYGMNFKTMPELNWTWGYPLAIALMLVSALVPFIYFKKRGWY